MTKKIYYTRRKTSLPTCPNCGRHGELTTMITGAQIFNHVALNHGWCTEVTDSCFIPSPHSLEVQRGREYLLPVLRIELARTKDHTTSAWRMLMDMDSDEVMRRVNERGYFWDEKLKALKRRVTATA